MNKANLATLEQVSVRCACPHEAHDFTPWLAENLDRLASALGIQRLELEDTEVQVGPYWADIVARVPQDGARVLIENQLEPADLQHLGQVLAYLAGLEAQIIVWVASDFADPHLSAIRWLNEHTTDPFAFFAVRVGVVRIGDSQLAPIFDILERPNEWDRQVQIASAPEGLSEVGRFRRDFWTYFASRRPDAPSLRQGYAGSNVWHPVEESGLRIVQYLAQHDIGIYLTGKLGELGKEYVPRINAYRETLGEALSNDRIKEGENTNCLSLLTINSRDRGNWDQMADWLDESSGRCTSACCGAASLRRTKPGACLPSTTAH